MQPTTRKNSHSKTVSWRPSRPLDPTLRSSSPLTSSSSNPQRSSSPLALSPAPPSSPPEFTRRSSTADPFSASCKAPPHALPVFSKNTPHSKHPFSLRESRGIGVDTLQEKGLVLGAFFNDSDGVSTEQSWSPSPSPSASSSPSLSVASDQEGMPVSPLGPRITRGRLEKGHADHWSPSEAENAEQEHTGDNTISAPDSHMPISCLTPVASGRQTNRKAQHRRTYSRAFSRHTSHPYEAFGAIGSPPKYSKDERTPCSTHTRSQRSSSQFSHTLSRQRKASEREVHSPFRLDSRVNFSATPGGTDATYPEWRAVRQAVNRAFDLVSPIVHLDRQGLTYLPPTIADLGDFVALASEPRRKHPPRPDEASRGEELGPLAGRNGARGRAPWVRRASEAVLDSLGDAGDPGGVQIFLAHNPLHILPSALFSVSNLRVLSLRSTALDVLPPAIGTLINLRELNIGNNKLVRL